MKRVVYTCTYQTIDERKQYTSSVQRLQTDFAVTSCVISGAERVKSVCHVTRHALSSQYRPALDTSAT